VGDTSKGREGWSDNGLGHGQQISQGS
jgi:hypothetical protein